jgi:phage-related protein
MKAAIFHPAAREAIQSFPVEVRKELGKALYDLQMGEPLSMPLSRTIASLAPGAAELRIRDHSGIYRVFYFVRIKAGNSGISCVCEEGRATPERELELGRKRLKELVHEED